MEYGYLFTTLVVAIGVCHIVWRAIGVISEHLGVSGNDQYYRMSRSSRKRIDWYVFFSPSDLTPPAGKAVTAGNNVTTEKTDGTQRAGREVKRSRPRLYVGK